MKFTISSLMLFLSAGVASAEIAVGSSLEWLTCSADYVAVANIKKVERKDGYDHCTLEIAEVIQARIMPGAAPVMSFRTDSVWFSADKAMKSKKGVLVFLRLAKDSVPALEGKLVPCDHYALVDLSAPGKYIIDQREQVLQDPKEILDTCRKAAKAWSDYSRQNPGAKVERGRVEVNIGSPAGQALWGGSSVYMNVPKFKAK